jgi:hypothetical protein
MQPLHLEIVDFADGIKDAAIDHCDTRAALTYTRWQFGQVKSAAKIPCSIKKKYIDSADDIVRAALGENDKATALDALSFQAKAYGSKSVWKKDAENAMRHIAEINPPLPLLIEHLAREAGTQKHIAAHGKPAL